MSSLIAAIPEPPCDVSGPPRCGASAMHADVPRVLTALLECGKDTSEPVREEVEAACVRLGLKDPTAGGRRGGGCGPGGVGK